MTMKKQILTRTVLLASAIALVGCQTNLPLVPSEGGDVPSATQQPGTGKVALNIHWPEAPDFRTQVMPGRTKAVMIRFQRVDANDQPIAGGVLAPSGTAIGDVLYDRNEAYYQQFAMKSGQSVKLIAIAYDRSKAELASMTDAERAQYEIGRGERIADVIPGHTYYVSIEIKVPAEKAPRLDPLLNPMLELDKPIRVSGANLAAPPGGYGAWAYLRAEGPSTDQYAYYPSAYVQVRPLSDKEAELNVSAGDLGENLEAYFRDKEGKVKLYLTFYSDNVPSNPIEVQLPKAGNLDASVSFQNGTTATPSTGVAGRYFLDIAETFKLPRTLGTIWEYEINDNGSLSTQSFEIRYEQNPFGNFHHPVIPFSQIEGGGQLQRLGTEPYWLPGASASVMAVRYYAPEVARSYMPNAQGYATGGSDLWFVEGVGLVKKVFRGAAKRYDGGWGHLTTTVILKRHSATSAAQ